MITLPIQNQEELQALLGLFDAAVRQLGLNAAQSVAVFQARLQEQVNAHNKKAAAKAPAGEGAAPSKPLRRSGKNKGGQ